MKLSFIIFTPVVFSVVALATSILAKNTVQNSSGEKPLPHVFVSILMKVKAKTHVPVLLPSKLPGSFGRAGFAYIGDATESKYDVSLYYSSDTSDASFAAYFSGDSAPNYDPKEMGDAVRLAHGLEGYVRPVSCGGSCAPANIWWEENGVLYQIQLKLSSGTKYRSQERTMVDVADSAILAGPR